MSRPKIDPVERLLDAYAALTIEEAQQFNYLLQRWNKWNEMHDGPPTKPARVRKAKEPAEVAGA